MGMQFFRAKLEISELYDVTMGFRRRAKKTNVTPQSTQ
jgi:hypothetical protein